MTIIFTGAMFWFMRAPTRFPTRAIGSTAPPGVGRSPPIPPSQGFTLDLNNNLRVYSTAIFFILLKLFLNPMVMLNYFWIPNLNENLFYQHFDTGS